jgi:hypothetical protein
MALLTMIMTLPLLFIAYEKNHDNENLYTGKLFLMWFICQLYITINYKIKVPIGIILAFTMICNEETNKRSKFVAFITGCISFLSSNLVYLLYSI